jgi:site-specific recombinase XerC
MKRVAQPALSKGQQTLDQYTRSLQQIEDLSAVTIHNYVSDLRQIIAWYEAGFQQEQDEQYFTPRAIASSLLSFIFVERSRIRCRMWRR